MTHFYPEMQQTAPASAIIIGCIVRGGYYVKWTAADHGKVLAAMTATKTSAKQVEEFVTIKGETKWSAMMTPKAYGKLKAMGVASTECLLD